ncbi:hypothetical protein TI06_23315, partial [Vibrio vulnificus]
DGKGRRKGRGDDPEGIGAFKKNRSQLVEVGAVFAETLGDSGVGVEQGGLEAPVQRLDVGVLPLAAVFPQALAAEAQVLAGVGG